MKKKRIVKAVVLSALVLFMSGLAWAQQGDAPSDNMQIVREKIQADKKLLVASNMNLTENEAKAFWSVYDSYQKDLMALNERAFKNIGDYAANADKMTDDIAKKVVNEYLAIESDRQKLRQSYLPKFAKVLPYRKVMRYYQLENKIMAVINYDAARQIPLVD
ncbi:MAG: hypothetical protein MUD15_13330 [Desulfobacterota bacterium]|nr:hypothetical protein [Thermodesulfobacteriota bacterium]